MTYCTHTVYLSVGVFFSSSICWMILQTILNLRLYLISFFNLFFWACGKFQKSNIIWPTHRALFGCGLFVGGL
jgi:hypothetical protein